MMPCCTGRYIIQRHCKDGDFGNGKDVPKKNFRFECCVADTDPLLQEY